MTAVKSIILLRSYGSQIPINYRSLSTLGQILPSWSTLLGQLVFRKE